MIALVKWPKKPRSPHTAYLKFCNQREIDERSAARHGWTDGLANRHDAAVHLYACKPHWYNEPICWPIYLANWRRGQEAYKKGRKDGAA